MACAKSGPYEVEGSLHNRVLRPPEVIVCEQPTSGIVKQHGENPRPALRYANTRSFDSATTSLSEVVAPLRMTS